MRTSLLLFLANLTACVQCGEGTKLEDGACVADEEEDDTGSGDTDTGVDDSSTDSDTVGDSDTDTDSDGDTGVDDSGDSGQDSGEDSGSDSGEDTSPSWTVCDDGVAPYDDLQDAVDDAADGDTITVCAGVWDYIELSRNELTLAGEGADVTTIDAGSGHTAVTIDDSTVTISGFTLTGTSTTHGGVSALYAYESAVTLEDVRLAENESTSTAGYVAYLVQGDATLEGVVFEDNATSGWVLAVEYGSLAMRHSIFRDNAPASSRNEGGYLLTVYQADADVSNNLFHDNDVMGSGNVVMLNGQGANLWFYNNTLYGNSGNTGEPVVYLSEGVVFENNIVYNTDMRGVSYQSAGTTVSYNLSFGHDDYNFNDYSGVTEVGNLEQDPRLNDPESGDFTLNAGFSPCVNAGDPLTGYNDADGSRNDMGAFGGPNGSW